MVGEQPRPPDSRVEGVGEPGGPRPNRSGHLVGNHQDGQIGRAVVGDRLDKQPSGHGGRRASGAHQAEQLARTQMHGDGGVGHRSESVEHRACLVGLGEPVGGRLRSEGEGAVGGNQRHEIVVGGSSLPEPNAGLADPSDRLGQMRVQIATVAGLRRVGRLGRSLEVHHGCLCPAPGSSAISAVAPAVVHPMGAYHQRTDQGEQSHVGAVEHCHQRADQQRSGERGPAERDGARRSPRLPSRNRKRLRRYRRCRSGRAVEGDLARGGWPQDSSQAGRAVVGSVANLDQCPAQPQRCTSLRRERLIAAHLDEGRSIPALHAGVSGSQPHAGQGYVGVGGAAHAQPIGRKQMALSGAQPSNHLQRPPRLVGCWTGSDAHSGAVGHPGLVKSAVGFHPLVAHPEAGNRRRETQNLRQLPDVGRYAVGDAHLPGSFRTVVEQAHGCGNGGG